MNVRKIGVRLIAAALLTLSAGCVQNKIVIRVKPDGSGDILVTRILGAETVRIIEVQFEQARSQMAGMEGMEDAFPKDLFYNEEALKQEAAWFGANVEFISSRKIDQGGRRGSLAHYRFADIRAVSLRHESFSIEAIQRSLTMMDGDITPAPTSVSPERAFTFEFEPGDVAQVTVRPPVYPEPTTAEGAHAHAGMQVVQMQQGLTMWMQQTGSTEAPFGLTGQETISEMMAKLLKDAELEVQIEVVGELVQSDARYPQADRPTRFTLLAVRPEVVAQDANPERFFAGSIGHDSLKFLATMVGMPDSRIETNRSISIQFK